MKTEYSDEHISAFIDGELDQEERVRLLLAEQEDEELARRINEARMLKEKVQLAYLDFAQDTERSNATKCSSLIARHRSLVAGFLLLVGVAALFTSVVNRNDDITQTLQLMKDTPPIMATSIAGAVGSHNRVVIHVSAYDEAGFETAIDEIEALLSQRKTASALNIEVIANGQGLKLLDAKTSGLALRLERLSQQFDNLDVVACAKSLAQLASSGEPVNLLKSILTTPSAPQQIARRTSEGWIYLKI
jgi:intracellular sulfur oxidation DsrE/DsrF family protein